jgi:tetratricopeptide (TPR) repeat protein
VLSSLNIDAILKILQEVNNTEELLFLFLIEIVFWFCFSFILIQFLPKKYKLYKKEIFIFFVVINVGLLFVGILLTLIMVLFGLSWATHRVSRPHYETVYLDEQSATFPMVYSEFNEGLLSVESQYEDSVSSDAKIKSLKILYDSNAQGNIGKIQHFLADSSDETRLYAFALISDFEKKLNNSIKELQKKIETAYSLEHKERQSYELARVYWQFIFHGVASEQLTSFYTQKIETILKEIKHNSSAFILLGKIKIFNKEYNQAEEYFNKAIALGVPINTLSMFLAEIKYGQKKYDEVSKYILPEAFDIDLRLKPLIQVWRTS